jgi:hypothetical protein
MRSKLSTSNPYLRDSELRESMVFKSVASSSAIEGIRAPFRRPEHPDKSTATNRTKHTDKSTLTSA